MAALSLSSPWICPVCGAHYPPATEPPSICRICQDERQWVPPGGQRFTTLDELAARGYRSDVRPLEPGLTGIGVEGDLGVGQRGVLVRTPDGNLLWDPPAFLDDTAVEVVRDAGGLSALSASHPHMYGAIVEWSLRFDAPILLAHADAAWLTRPHPAVHHWAGSREALPGVTLVQCGGHFPGSAVVHWAAGAGGAGALLTGDTVFVTPGADRLTFAWSAPNRLPLPERGVRRITRALAPYRFQRVYDGWWDAVLDGDAERVLERSARRYVQFLRGDAPGAL